MDERKAIRDIRASEILGDSKGSPATVLSDAPIKQVIDAMIDRSITRKVYVLDKNGVLVGTITFETLLRFAGYTLGVRETGITSFFKMLGEIGDEKASQVMTQPIKITANEPIVNVARLMVDNHLNDLPVVDGKGRLVGELNGMEILKYARGKW